MGDNGNEGTTRSVISDTSDPTRDPKPRLRPRKDHTPWERPRWRRRKWPLMDFARNRRDAVSHGVPHLGHLVS